MGLIEWQPELRTAGGEVLSIHRNGDWIGDAYLVYRENDWLTGTVQLDEEYVDSSEIGGIVRELKSHLLNLSYALNVSDHNVSIFYGQYSLLEDYLDPDVDRFRLKEQEDPEQVKSYERWVVGQGEQGIEYQVYDEGKNLVAEAVVDIKGTRIIGEIHFTREPNDQEMEDIEAILLKDYDHDLIDQYNLTYFVNGQEYEEVEVEVADEQEADGEEDELVYLLETEEEDDYEERERAQVVFQLVDKKKRPLGEAAFLYSEDGVDVTVDLDIKPNEDTSNHLMKTVFQEALTEPMEWVNIRMYYQGKVVDGFHFERGKGKRKLTV